MFAWIMSLLGALSQPASSGWQTGILHVRNDNGKGPAAIYINTTGPTPGWNFPNNTWQTVDVTKIADANLPVTTKAIQLHGILIVTHGPGVEDCGIDAAFRVPGNGLTEGNYSEQMVVPYGIGGGRQNTTVWVPVKDGKFEFWWKRVPDPSSCSYGMNLTVQAYID